MYLLWGVKQKSQTSSTSWSKKEYFCFLGGWIKVPPIQTEQKHAPITCLAWAYYMAIFMQGSVTTLSCTVLVFYPKPGHQESLAKDTNILETDILHILIRRRTTQPSHLSCIWAHHNHTKQPQKVLSYQYNICNMHYQHCMNTAWEAEQVLPKSLYLLSASQSTGFRIQW